MCKNYVIILSFYNCIIVYYTNMKKILGYKNNTNCALLSYTSLSLTFYFEMHTLP